MEFLVAIGTGIVGKIAEHTVQPIGRQVGYLFHYKSNLRNLQTQLQDLDAAKDGVLHTVESVTRRGNKRVEPAVENWKTRVNDITGEANKFLKDELHAQTKCLYGFCPNLMLRYQLSRKSTKLADEVVKLYGQKDFSKFAYDVCPQEVFSLSTGDYKAFDSRISTMKRIMDELRSPITHMIGVYGIGGVGKTTLVKEVFRQATQDKELFDDVVIVQDVKQIPDLDGIQKSIVEKLGMGILDDETTEGRARRLCDRIKDKKFLIILDDVGERIDLEAVGIPNVATCKILLTARSRGVLSSVMHTQKEFPLEILDQKETWSLFEEMAGDVVKDPTIRTVATQVAEKCGGLPVLVVTVASALKNRSRLQAWKDALRRLKVFDREELTEKAYSVIEWSYDQLDDKDLKPLFLLCGITVVGNYISFRNLLYFGMGLGLFKNIDTVEEARNSLHSLVEKLKDFRLLLDDDHDGTYVRMHDLVRDVAFSIAGKDQHVLSVASGGELKEWPNKDFFKKCTTVFLPRCSIPRLPEVLQCPELSMFFWSCNYGNSPEIPGNFFADMKKLKVLGMTTLRIPSLPPSLEFLKNLQTLCLDECQLGDIVPIGQLSNLEILTFNNSHGIKQLPKEIGQLTCLRLLDLSNCAGLEVISPNVISNLKRLEDLRMRNSFKNWEVEGVLTGEKSNASLLELKHLSRLTALDIHIPDANILPIDLFSNMCLERYQIVIGDSSWMNERTLNTLELKLDTSNELGQGLKQLLKSSEDLSLDGKGVIDIVHELGSGDFQQLQRLHVESNAQFTYMIISGKVALPNLTSLIVGGIDGLRFLLSSSLARSLVQLKHLEISNCEILEEIIAKEEGVETTLPPKLECVKLSDLPNLTRFCSVVYIEFLSLEELNLRNCTKLGPFVLDPMSKNITVCKEFEERDSKEINLDVETSNVSLFDEKVKFPSLKRLVISKLPKLITIWQNRLAPESCCKIREVQAFNVKEMNDSSSNTLFALNSVDIRECGSLKNIFPASMVRGLQQLQELCVQNCGVLEEIFAKEEGVETTNPPKFVLSKVTSVNFTGLARFRSFYPGMHVSKWPLLKRLEVVDCDKVEIFAAAVSMSEEKQHELDGSCDPIKQSLFLIEKDSFPNLEKLTLKLGGMEIWNGPPPAEFFSKLKSIDFDLQRSNSNIKTAAAMIQKLQNLEMIGVNCGPFEEIFVDAVGTLSRIKHLRLSFMDKLMHLGNENAQVGHPVFPNLEILKVYFCPRLKNLSAISFRNLTTLTVFGCGRLEYVTTYSVAKSLMQLKRLSVFQCERMIGIIVANRNGDDDDAGNDEISFSRLQRLELSRLPRLQGFCLGNCAVKFPSLETLIMSNRLKLKIFPHDDTVHVTREKPDTDVSDEESDSEVGDDNNNGGGGSNMPDEEDN